MAQGSCLLAERRVCSWPGPQVRGRLPSRNSFKSYQSNANRMSDNAKRCPIRSMKMNFEDAHPKWSISAKSTTFQPAWLDSLFCTNISSNRDNFLYFNVPTICPTKLWFIFATNCDFQDETSFCKNVALNYQNRLRKVIWVDPGQNMRFWIPFLVRRHPQKVGNVEVRRLGIINPAPNRLLSLTVS